MGAIAGGVVGGLAVLIVILCLILCCLRRKKKSKKDHAVDGEGLDILATQDTMMSERTPRSTADSVDGSKRVKTKRKRATGRPSGLNIFPAGMSDPLTKTGLADRPAVRASGWISGERLSGRSRLGPGTVPRHVGRHPDRESRWSMGSP